jgi:hypothetical protein
LQIVRLLRLLKLLRLMKASRIAKRIFAASGLSFHTKALLSLLVLLTVVVHLMACAWRAFPLAFGEEESWLGHYDKNPAWRFSKGGPGTKASALDEYREAFVYTLKLVKCYVHPTPTAENRQEQIFTAMGSIMLTCVYAYSLGEVIKVS